MTLKTTIITLTLALLQCQCLVISCSAIDAAGASPMTLGGEHQDQPPPVFFDANEAKISHDLNPKSADLLEFVDPDSPRIAPNGCVREYWTSDEKAQIRRMVDRLLLISPSLVIGAANNRKILIFRTKSLSTSEDSWSIFEKPKPDCAQTCPNGIVLSDRFFNVNSRFRLFVHELVHAADAARVFAYSKAWTDFMSGTIGNARISLRNLPSEEGKAYLKQLRLRGLIPTAYACKNLTEALAEVVSCTIDGSFGPNGELLKLVKEFLSIEPLRLDLNRQLADACAAIDSKAYDKSITILSTALAERGDAPVLQCYLAECNFALHKYSESLRWCYEARTRLKEQQVPSSEDISINICRVQEYCFSIRKEHAESLTVLNKVLSEILFDDLLLYQRCFSERALNEISNACADLYLSCFARDYLAPLRDAPANQALMAELLDKTVLQFPHYRVGYLQKGYFEQWKGEHEPEPEMRQQLLLKALADYQKALAFEEKANCGSAVFCCYLCVKLGRIQEAEAYCAKAEQENPSAVEAALMKTMVLSCHNEAEAADALDAVVALLLRQRKLKYSILQSGVFEIQKHTKDKL